MFTVLIGCILLNDSCSMLDMFYSILCCVGFMFVAKPNFLVNFTVEYQSSFAIACALLGAFMSAVAYVFIRKVGQMVHVMVHIVYFGLVTILLGLPVLLVEYPYLKIPSAQDLSVFIILGILAFLAQYFINLGLQMAPPGPGK